MNGFRNPNPLLKALWKAQEGKCFHCDQPMIFLRIPGQKPGQYATREHIYPVSRYASHGLHNNIVLAHARCNSLRGAPEPSPDEIAKAKEIYARLGLNAFVYATMNDKDAAAFLGYLKDVGASLEEKEAYIKSQGPAPISRLGDIWPHQPEATPQPQEQHQGDQQQVPE